MSRTGWSRGTEFESKKGLEIALIKAEFDGQSFLLPSGEALPLFKIGAKVDIRVSVTYFQDQKQARPYATSKSVELLPAGTRLFAVVKNLSAKDDYEFLTPPERQFSPVERQDRDYVKWCLEQMRRSGFAQGVEPLNPEGAVEVVLQKPLMLTLRGDKKPKLEHCYCEIPYFAHTEDRQNGQAHSLNHAFTKISEYFETDRISHTGNAFTRYFCEHIGRFQRIDALASLMK
ncbi:hypothetical protein [Propionivibrio sp.]|uniref:hypothetical protein n=1 Tax=Propionivibrio sp. TaxID=2212460 RepID=UPI003BEF9C05